MKKALVMTFVLVLGFGLFAWAQTWEGTWDTDITVYPSVAEFSDFIGFDSDLTVTYSIGGWDFSMDADFTEAGMDGLDFGANGVIGAFTFDIDMDFEPMYLTDVTTAYTSLLNLTTAEKAAACLQTDSWKYASKTVTNTYVPAFDDLTASVDVSIAGVSIGALFFLESTDSDVSKTYTNWEFLLFPVQVNATGTTQTAPTVGTSTVASSVKVGSGWKFTLSGSLAGATATSYTYFNLREYMYNDYMALLGYTTYTKNVLKKYGSIYGLACDGCVPFFYEEYILIEGLAFADCLTVDMGLMFTCCDFQWVGFLLRDIGLGCCWDLGFDLFFKFETTAKTVTFEPEITLANACFTLDAAVTYSATSGTFSITGIEIEGISYTHDFNGVTVTFAQTWDYTDNPLIGTASTITHWNGNYLYFWKPDANETDNSVLPVAPATTVPGAIDSTGAGAYVLTAIGCSKEIATVYNKLSLDFDADGCCGGLFDLDVDTYFGSIATWDLEAVYGTYYWDENNNGAYLGANEVIEYLGAAWGYADYVLVTSSTTDVVPAASVYVAGETECNECPTADTINESSKLVGFYGNTGTAKTSLLGWVETDAEIVFGVGSNISLGLGLDVNWWGWDNISFSIEFTW